jgi:poly-gamma-glutamate capsule biosynthesis protein CapA/YwtB (metallophosphatase superfamily)
VRSLALILRAGAVVALVAVIVAAVVEGAPRLETERRSVPNEQPLEADGGSAAPKPTPPRAPSDIVTLALAGDILLERDGRLPRFSGRATFAGVKADLAGDVVLGNLLTTLVEDDTCDDGCDPVRAPDSFAPSLRGAGFTVLGLANAEAGAFGRDGRRETADALEAAGVLHAGAPGVTARQKVVKSVVAVTGLAANLRTGYLPNMTSARRQIRRAVAAADLVVASVHLPPDAPRADVRRLAHMLVDEGADLVVGNGSTTLGGMEWYRGRLVAYSLGSFAGSREGLTQTGAPSAILRVTLRSDGRFETATIVATQRLAGRPTLDPSEAAHGVIRERSRQEFGARAVRIAPSGLVLPPR